MGWLLGLTPQVPPLYWVFVLARKYIVESYPLVVREKMDYFVSEGFSPLSIFKWLEATMFPVWRKERKQEWCVSRKTVYNYMRKRCPENLLASDSYLRDARKRVDSNVDSMGEIRDSLKLIDDLIKTFDKRSDVNKIGWLIAIAVVNMFGWILYFLFGRLPVEKSEDEESWD